MSARNQHASRPLEAWKSEITDNFAARVLAVASEVETFEADPAASAAEQAAAAIDAAYTWAHPRRRHLYPDAYGVGLQLLQMIATEGLDPCNQPE